MYAGLDLEQVLPIWQATPIISVIKELWPWGLADREGVFTLPVFSTDTEKSWLWVIHR
jgi:hypothetical protein